MKNLTNQSNEALSEAVFTDAYFSTEKNDIDYLMALIAEEFIHTQAQMDDLILELLSQGLAA